MIHNSLRHLVRIALTAWAAATFVFVMLRMAGDPMAVLLPGDVPQDILDIYAARYGFDRPIWAQYLSYLASILQGDFGYSFRTGGPAIDLFLDRLPATLALTGTALAIAVTLGVAAGMAAAIYRDSVLDRSLMTLSVFGFATPNFFFGIVLILIFTLNLRWLPSSGFESWTSLIMPAATLGLASAGAYARMTRSSLLEVLGQPFMEMARAKGLALSRVLVMHGLRAALIPLVGLLGFSIGAMIAGAVVTETVFAWPGIGRLMVISVAERDLAVVQIVVIFSALAVSITNAVIDILLSLLDPRIGSARREAQ